MDAKGKRLAKRTRPWRLPGYWNTSLRVKFSLYVLLGICMYALLIGNVLPERYELSEGSESPETIVAPVDRIDEKATEEARSEAAATVPLQHKIDEQVTTNQVEKINRLFIDARRNVDDKALTERERIENIADRAAFDLSDEVLLKMVRISGDELVTTQAMTRRVVQDVMSSGVSEQEGDEAKKRIDQQLVTSNLGSNARFVAREVARQAIVVNIVYDKAKTEAMRQAAADSVEPVRINRGDPVVFKGELITQQQYRQLTELGLLNDAKNIWPYVGLALFIMLMLAFLYFSIHTAKHSFTLDNTRLSMLVLIIALNLGTMKFVSLGQTVETSYFGYIAPVALGSMLIAVLIDVRLALFAGIVFSVFAAMMFNPEGRVLFDFRFGLYTLIACSTGAFALHNARQRSSVLRAGLLVSAVNVLPISAIFMLSTSGYSWEDIFKSIGFGVGGGILAAVLTLGLLPFFEAAFGILSSMKLLELANPNQPLLRKLLIETPGTYHHSVIVGNLAEAAAEAIGADGLLARVGAYYHDLGKTKRAQFFIENQVHGDNPHDKISAHLSKTIIISHVRDGVEILREANIPKPILDIAEQHHGTTLLKFFYYKAMKQEDGAQVLEEDFRYPGPKPQSKVAAIVNIADSVEAAVRSIGRPTPSRIEALVRKIIRDRLEDGQFDECDITLKELDLIGKSILETLNGIFHQRIEYPEEMPVKGAKHA